MNCRVWCRAERGALAVYISGIFRSLATGYLIIYVKLTLSCAIANMCGVHFVPVYLLFYGEVNKCGRPR